MRHAARLLLSCALLFGCARGGDETDDAGVVVHLDSGPPPDVDASTPTPDAGAPSDDAGSPGVDGGPTGTDAGPDGGPSPLCVGVDCSSLDGLCTVGFCNPDTGSCSTAPAPVGTACDDGDPCTTSDACAGAGVCDGAPVDCSSADTACGTGVCDPSTGACETSPVADGTDCDTDPSDCVAETCQAGACTPAPAADCSSCSSGGGTVCAGGVCGAAPTTLTYDFEGGLPMGWTVGGTTGWVVDGARVHGGAMAAHSGAISDSQTSTMTATFTTMVAAEIAFWFYTSTESGFDYLEVWVDGARQGRWAGSNAWTQTTVSLGGAGAHTVEWRYTKDGSVSSGDDRVWIDDVVVRPGSPARASSRGPCRPAGRRAGTRRGSRPPRARTAAATRRRAGTSRTARSRASTAR